MALERPQLRAKAGTIAQAERPESWPGVSAGGKQLKSPQDSSEDAMLRKRRTHVQRPLTTTGRLGTRSYGSRNQDNSLSARGVSSVSNRTPRDRESPTRAVSFVSSPTQDPRFGRLMQWLVPLPTAKPNGRSSNDGTPRTNSVRKEGKEICFRDLCLQDTCRIVYDIMKIDGPRAADSKIKRKKKT